MKLQPKVLSVVGARPNLMKIGPIIKEIEREGSLDSILLHTGQHYDHEMSGLFFEELGIPPPDVELGVGSGSHAWQTAEIMKRIEPVLARTHPEVVLVVGDVNSTAACALVASKMCIPLAHVEAGLRSFDRTMPEEINRIVTDALADFLFTSEPSGTDNLRREGISPSKIHFVGNVMIDSLLSFREKAARSDIRRRLGLNGDHAVVTLHRPSNVDDRKVFARVLHALERLQRRLPIVFPVHPRTRAALESAGASVLSRHRLILTEPLGYIDFLHLLSTARLVLTDSGGIQEETTILRVPCLTLRSSTERPVTVTQGTNVLTGPDPERILEEAERALAGRPLPDCAPEKWDGRAAERIVEVLARELGGLS